MTDRASAPNWRDLVKRQAAATPSPPPPTPALEKLLAERRELEARMAALTGAPADPHAARAFPVPSMAERRAAHERWETRRDARAIAAAADRAASRRELTPPTGDAAFPVPEPAGGGTPIDPRRWYAARDAEVGAPRGRRAAVPADLFRDARQRRPRDQEDLASDAGGEPAQTERPRRTDDAYAALDARRSRGAAQRVSPGADSPPPPALRSLDRPRPAASAAAKAAPGTSSATRGRAAERSRPAPESTREPVERVKAVAERVRAPAERGSADRFADRPIGADLRRAGDAALARPMVREAARSGLGDAAGRLGAERLAKPKATIEKIVAKSRDALARADGAGRKIEDAWAKRRDLSFGPDLASYARGYEQRSARLLGVETGSLNDLAQRTEAGRQAAIARRADTRRAEAADAQRRERALQRRKADRSDA